MRPGRPIFYILCVLYGAMVVSFFWFRRPAPALPSTASAPVVTAASSDSGNTLLQTNTTLVFTNTFHWGELEANDYREFIRRLRGIGCPEQTIRDLVIADLDKMFASKVQGIYPLRKDLHYWESEEEELANNYDQRIWQRKLREIEQEKAKILRDLLGVDLAAERQRVKGESDKLERRLSFLTEQRRSEVRQVLDASEDRINAVLEKSWETGVPLSAEDRAKLKDFREEKELALGKILTPEERERFDLWMSPTAESLRHDFYGLGASEDDFKAVYQLRKEFDSVWTREDIDTSNEEMMKAWGGALIQLENQIKDVLGEDKFSMYQRGQDTRFHELNATASRFGLSREAAAEAYEYLRLAQQEKDRVLAAGSFTAEQQAGILRQIDSETERALTELLGSGPFHYFNRRTQ